MTPPAINFSAFIGKEKMKNTGSNLMDWFRNLRIILNVARRIYVLDAPLSDPPIETASEDEKKVFRTRKDDYGVVQCAMMYGLESELQQHFKKNGPYEIMQRSK
jgi:hypothetical protein